MEKRAFLPLMFGVDDIAAFHRIHDAIDPKRIANRGKMFPDEATAAMDSASQPAGAHFG